MSGQMKAWLVPAMILAITAPAALLAHDVSVPPWRGQTGTTFQEWTFPSSQNPAAPQVITNPYGTASATVTLGLFASGWLNQLPGMGTQTGYWDIGGTNAKIALNVANKRLPAGYTEVRVQVTYFKDITQAPVVAVTDGARQSGQTILVEHVSTGGDWYVDQSVWRIESCPNQVAVVLTTLPAWGAVIDQIVVDTQSVSSVVCADPHTPQADLNGDAWVDGVDYGLFAGCFNGTGNPINPGCECADLDGDNSVDGVDYGLFAGCFNGTGNTSPCH